MEQDDLERGLEQALAQFERTRRLLGETAADLASETVTLWSRNRWVAVTAALDGEVVDVRFSGGGWRAAAPAELGAAFVDLLGQVRQQVDRESQARLARVLPGTLKLPRSSVSDEEFLEEITRSVRAAVQEDASTSILRSEP